MPSSFLPLSSSSLNLSYEAMQHQLSARKAAHKCPLRLKVQRMTVVDAGSAGFSFVSFYPRSRHEAVQSLVSREEVVPERRYMYSTQSIGHGVVHSATRRANSVVWSGAIIIPPTQLGFCGGFEASGLQVAVSGHFFMSFSLFCEAGFECAVEEMKVLSVAEAQSREVAAAEPLRGSCSL